MKVYKNKKWTAAIHKQHDCVYMIDAEIDQYKIYQRIYRKSY